jgi:hypothetical protein
MTIDVGSLLTTVTGNAAHTVANVGAAVGGSNSFFATLAIGIGMFYMLEKGVGGWGVIIAGGFILASLAGAHP